MAIKKTELYSSVWENVDNVCVLYYIGARNSKRTDYSQQDRVVDNE